MIVRIWQGITLATKTEEYLEYLNHCVIPAYQRAKGNMGFFVIKEPHGELVHFLLTAVFLWIRNDRWNEKRSEHTNKCTTLGLPGAF